MTDFIRAMSDALDVPAMFLLVCLLALYASLRGKFDVAEASKDESGKQSWSRLCIVGSFVISSWLLIYLSMSFVHTSVTWADALDALFKYYALFMLTWPGAKSLDRLVEKWDGTMPFTKKTT